MAQLIAFVAALTTTCSAAFAQAEPAGDRPSAVEARSGELRTEPLPFIPAPSINDAKILQALGEKTRFEFADVALSDVVDYIKQKHKIEVQLDNKGLADAAVDPSAPITRSVDGISLRRALRLILEDLDLTYVLQDEVLTITSKEKADEILITRIYPIDDILDKGGTRRITTSQLLEAFVATVQPDSWDERGGPGTITPMGGFLVVSQLFECHEEIIDLLASIRTALRREAVAVVGEQAADVEGGEELRVVLYPISQISNEDAMKAVQTLVDPNAWNGQGGKGTVCAVTQRFRQPAADDPNHIGEYRTVAVRQTVDVHVQVRRLLRRLDTPPFVPPFVPFGWVPVP